MRAFPLNRLIAVLLVAFLAACSSKPTEDTSSEDTQAATSSETSSVAPVAPSEPVKPQASSIPLTADNFHNHPSNYDGSTDTKTIYFAFDDSSVPLLPSRRCVPTPTT